MVMVIRLIVDDDDDEDDDDGDCYKTSSSDFCKIHISDFHKSHSSDLYKSQFYTVKVHVTWSNRMVFIMIYRRLPTNTAKLHYDF